MSLKQAYLDAIDGKSPVIMQACDDLIDSIDLAPLSEQVQAIACINAAVCCAMQIVDDKLGLVDTVASESVTHLTATMLEAIDNWINKVCKNAASNS